MAPVEATCFCNNRGGVGKTFWAFQVACEAACARPGKKVLVLDFSIYSHLSALLAGGTAQASPLSPMNGTVSLMNCTTPGTRIEGLMRRLDKPAEKRLFGLLGAQPAEVIDLQEYAVRVSDTNQAIPPNLYLVPSVGMTSWSKLNDLEKPVWCKKGEEWVSIAQKLRHAIDALPAEFETVFFDTDHLASSVFTKVALAVCDAVAVPCPTDTADFQRLYSAGDATQFEGTESLLTDVMLPMLKKSQLRARIQTMFFAQAASQKNAPTTTPAGIGLPFHPTKTMTTQMDSLVSIAWAACEQYPRYRDLFRDYYSGAPLTFETFAAKYFTACKIVPDVSKNLTASNGIPLCLMTPEAYILPNGLPCVSSLDVVSATKAEVVSLTAHIRGPCR